MRADIFRGARVVVRSELLNARWRSRQKNYFVPMKLEGLFQHVRKLHLMVASTNTIAVAITKAD